MKKTKDKINISVSIDKKLNQYMEEEISNKSKYIEWLIYQDLKKNVVNLEKIFI
jgi:hypothetical protein